MYTLFNWNTFLITASNRQLHNIQFLQNIKGHIKAKMNNFHSHIRTMNFTEILTFNFLAWDLT